MIEEIKGIDSTNVSFLVDVIKAYVNSAVAREAAERVAKDTELEEDISAWELLLEAEETARKELSALLGRMFRYDAENGSTIALTDLYGSGDITATGGVIGLHGVSAGGIIDPSDHSGGTGSYNVIKYSSIAAQTTEYTDTIPTAYAVKRVRDLVNAEINDRVIQISNVYTEIGKIDAKIGNAEITIAGKTFKIGEGMTAEELATALSLGSAAFKDAGFFATAEQGAKADTAIQKADIRFGTSDYGNGYIELSIGTTRYFAKPYGLGTAAYKEEGYFAKAADLERETVDRRQEQSQLAKDIKDATDLLGILAEDMAHYSDPITEEEFGNLPAKGKRLYFVVNNKGRLMYIYYGNTLIARRREGSETLSFIFPAIFPMVFG